MRNVLMLAVVAAAGLLLEHAAAAEAGAAAVPPVPAYQMREPLPDGDRLKGTGTGAQLYSNRCGTCHLPFGMGTNVLTVQRLALGEPPENGLLTNRTDLGRAYVEAVVRNGKGGMPRLSRVEVTDAELQRISEYLSGEKP